MKYEFTSSAEGIYEVKTGDKKYLGIASGLDSSILKTMDRNSFLEDPGYLWNGKELVPWRIENLFVNNGELVPAGSWIEGKLLSETEYSLPLLSDLASLLNALKEKDYKPSGLTPAGIYVTGSNGILIFPGSVMDLIIKHQEESYRLKWFDPFNHPDIRGENILSFFMGILAYRTFTGELPFSGSSITEIREKMRRSKPVPPDLKAPGLAAEISELVMDSIVPGQKHVSIENWKEIFSGCKEENLFPEELSAEEIEKIKSKAAYLEEKREKAFRRRQFMQKYGKLIAGIAAGIAVAAAVLYSPVKQALKPPVTAGLSPAKVVELYYSSINSLDSETMSDCTSSKTGKSDIKEVTGMYVIAKVRTGYEGKSGLISAEKWIASGKKPLPPGMSVYGITDLEIKRISEDTFTARYTKWYTEYPQNTEETGSGIPEGVGVTDRLHLVKNKNVWVIDLIERSTAND